MDKFKKCINWIYLKRDKSVVRGLDLSKRGSYGEGVKNVLWGTTGEQGGIRGEQQGEEGKKNLHWGVVVTRRGRAAVEADPGRARPFVSERAAGKKKKR